ncbi:MAG: hypothetical protein GX102_00075 [Porphyromonadaceae bacterium]|nr:hypothetical protein [Porphyromonadaceae bacterium]
MNTKTIIGIFLILFLYSCESNQLRQERLAREEQQRIELAERQEQNRIEREKRLEEERLERAMREEQERIERENRLEEERKKREIFERYINNSLRTGATPWARYYGANSPCNVSSCSQIVVRTPRDSDVVVTIKRNENVVQHAYIRANSSHTFELQNGKYQTFFYYGKGWDPNKQMRRADGTFILGGFISNEHFGKDDPERFSNQIVTYTLVLQQNGNFSTRPSNSMEAL